MKLFKKLGTYFSMLTLVLSGTSLNSIASEGEEGSEAFDDPNATEEESEEEAAAEEYRLERQLCASFTCTFGIHQTFEVHGSLFCTCSWQTAKQGAGKQTLLFYHRS